MYVCTNRANCCCCQARTCDVVHKLLNLAPKCATLLEVGLAQVLSESTIAIELVQKGDILKVGDQSNPACDCQYVWAGTNSSGYFWVFKNLGVPWRETGGCKQYISRY